MKKQEETQKTRGKEKSFKDLLRAVHEGKNGIEKARKLLEAGTDPNDKPGDEDSETPLHAAAASGHIPMVKLLLQYGADVNRRRNYRTPLDAAIEAKKLSMIKFLLKAGANVNAKGYLTPLVRAVDGGRTDIVRTLLDSGADVNTVTSSGTALCEAASQKNVKLIRMLLDAGADLRAPKGHSAPITKAAWSGDMPSFKMILDAGADMNDSGPFYTILEAAAAGGNLRMIKFILASVTEKPTKKELSDALWHAACFGHTNIVKFLIEQGAGVNIRPRWVRGYSQREKTAVEIAVYRGHFSTAELLLEAGANAKGGALVSAIEKGCSTEIITRMLESGADSNDIRVYETLARGVQRKHVDEKIVKCLLEHGMDVNNRSRERVRLTLLTAAAGSGQISLVKLLLAAGADVNATSAVGLSRKICTPLMAAAESGWTEIVPILLEAGADVNASVEGKTALGFAMENKHADVVDLLRAVGAYPCSSES